jgi:hypothetical protein
MSRADISDKLVHFTGPRDNWNEAFARLQSIMGERTMRGGNNKIRSGDHCVCFTEAPPRVAPWWLGQSNELQSLRSVRSHVRQEVDIREGWPPCHI